MIAEHKYCTGSNELQARSDELEAQVRATSAQLEEMQRKQKTLEARNTMLEKLVNLDRTQTGLSQGSPVVVSKAST